MNGIHMSQELMSALVNIYNIGYMQGHHDTVESQFVDIHPTDIDTYHEDVVQQILADIGFEDYLNRCKP